MVVWLVVRWLLVVGLCASFSFSRDRRRHAQLRASLPSAEKQEK